MHKARDCGALRYTRIILPEAAHRNARCSRLGRG